MECSSVVSSEIVERSSSRVYGCAGSANTSRAAPSSTILPAYMTATRSHASATMPRLCVISSSAVSKFSRRSARMREDLRLDDHVERGRRLVGDEQLRTQDERERDHDPLAHAAGELVRVLAEPRRRDAHPPERLERALADLAVAQLGLVLLERLAEVVLDPHQRIRAASSAPGRSARGRGRAACAAPSCDIADQVATAVDAPRRRPPRPRAAARGSRGRASTCRSPTRRPGRASRPRRCRARRRRRRGPGRAACRTRRAGRGPRRPGRVTGRLAPASRGSAPSRSTLPDRPLAQHRVRSSRSGPRRAASAP